MIGNIRGKLIDRGVGNVIIDCAGIGYEVSASRHTLAAMSSMGAEVSLRIFTQFLDHKISLYGFSSADERELFDLLITVKNVGPSSAIKILSAGEGPVAIAQMIAGKEVKALMGIKGIGKKTSEMLVVELHEKCSDLLKSWGANAASGPGTQNPLLVSHGHRSPVHKDVIMALVQLGYKKPQAEKVVDNLPENLDASLEMVMRQALQAMPR